MHLPVQGGVIDKQSDKERNLYTVRLVESGSAVTAAVSQRSRGASDRYEPGDHVLLNYAFNAWFITDLLPRFDDKKAAAPRQGSLAPGDAFYGNAVTSAGVHVTGGTVGVEGSGVDKDGKQRRAAGSYWIPDYDAIRDICRRYELDAAAGNFQMLHDDETNNSCTRIWTRTNAGTGLDGRVARVQMGFHRKPAGAVFSIYIFPPGPDPLSGKMDFDFKLDPEVEALPFGGQWPKLERDDWATRLFIEEDGTATYETAVVPAPSITPTTPAQVMARIKIYPDGFLTVESKNNVSLDAINALMQLKEDYTALITGNSFISIDGTLVTQCLDITMGDVAAAIPVANQNTFLWLVNQFYQAYVNHTHPDAQGGITGTPTELPEPPPTEEEGLTQNVILS